MIIRPENTSDFDAIHELVQTAFQTAKVSNGQEQEFVRELAAAGIIFRNWLWWRKQPGN